MWELCDRGTIFYDSISGRLNFIMNSLIALFKSQKPDELCISDFFSYFQP